MRLIDADALKEAMQEHTDCRGYLVCDPEEIIDLAPTEERPHGKWEYTGCVNDELQAEFCCSICDYSTYSMKYNFCPNCGADMKEGDENER